MKGKFVHSHSEMINFSNRETEWERGTAARRRELNIHRSVEAFFGRARAELSHFD